MYKLFTLRRGPLQIKTAKLKLQHVMASETNSAYNVADKSEPTDDMSIFKWTGGYNIVVRITSTIGIEEGPFTALPPELKDLTYKHAFRMQGFLDKKIYADVNRKQAGIINLINAYQASAPSTN